MLRPSAASLAMALSRAISTGDVQACERALQAGANASEKLSMPGSPDPSQDDETLQVVEDPWACVADGPAGPDGAGGSELTDLTEVAVLMDAPDPRLELPVHHAAGKGQINILQLLIFHGADPGAPDRWGGNAMHAAAANNQHDMLRELLRHGLDVNAMDVNGHTPLIAAAEAGAQEAAILLVDAGAHVQGSTASGRTALHLLCEHGCLDAASRLLRAGARVSERDARGRTALHVAAGFEGPICADLCALLCEHAKVTRPRPDDDPFLRRAVTPSNGVSVIDGRDGEGCTALHLAAARGLAANCSVLLHKGADPWVKNGAGLTALEVTVGADHPGAACIIQAFCDASRAGDLVNALLKELGVGLP